MVIAFPFINVIAHQGMDDSVDRDVVVVAIAPDRTFEVVSAIRRDDSGGSLILEARSRHGLFSRNAKYPFAYICSDADDVRVTFDGPGQINVLINHTLLGSVALDPHTLTVKRPIDDCEGD